MTTTGPPTDAGDRRAVLASFAALTSIAAFLFAAIGLVVVTAVGPSTASAGAGPTRVSVSLSEMKISPATISAASGPVVLEITNDGSAVHNLSIPALGKQTADLAAGASTTLDLGEVAAGSYDVRCEIVGHADAGMTATLAVSAGGGAAGDSAAAAGSHAGHGSDDYEAMNAKMRKGMAEGLETFVAGNSTKGVGNQKLEPTIEADGTKVFKLVPEIIEWEVSPGKIVEGWAYNGQIPGPWIRTEPNDKVKVVVENKLPVDTDVHFHGITTPFESDGLAPLTQPAIEPGQTYTYEWTNPSHPELGMYHAHDHGHIAVLNGLFAVFQVGDMPIPSGQFNHVNVPVIDKPTYELPMVLNDAGTIGLSLNGKSYPATAPISMKPGESLLLHYYNEGLAPHPMHLHHVPQLVIAKDGFPLAQPYLVDTLNVAPGERYSVLILPGANDIGIWAFHCHILTHAENDEGLFGMVTAMIVEDPNKPA
jgi:manganese oxidase